MLKKRHYKATVIKTAWYWQNNKERDKWNRIETPDIHPYKYSQLFFDKGLKAIQ